MYQFETYPIYKYPCQHSIEEMKMIKKRGNTNETVVNTDLRSPRISWSVLTMGAGVIASIVLNYAAYDTRITVLERAMLNNEKIILELKKDVKSLQDAVHDLDVRVKGAEHDSKNNKDRIKRTEKQIDHLNERLDEIKKKKGK